jgi:hypothetical protein
LQDIYIQMKVLRYQKLLKNLKSKVHGQTP